MLLFCNEIAGVMSFFALVCRRYVVEVILMIARITAMVTMCLMGSALLSSCQSGRAAHVPQGKEAELRLVMRSYSARGKRYVPMDAATALKYKAEGIASYYEAHGSRGALGERLRKGEYYAAHPTLPMPCRVRITNLSNGKSCEARIADRGPFSRNRIIDVSSAVARELGFLRKGLQRVRVEVISVGDGPGQLKAPDKD